MSPTRAPRQWTSQQARRERFIPVMRELVRTYQAFEAFDQVRHRARGLTTPQADVLFTLGNTDGLTFRELGERTLITKGTLTGVVDRLEAKGLVRRVASPDDGRCTLAILTAKGDRLFQRIYPEHIAALKERFDRLGRGEMDRIHRALARLRTIF